MAEWARPSSLAHEFVQNLKVMPILENPFETQGLVPDVIPAMPIARLEVEYPNNFAIDPGCRVEPKQVRQAPLNLKWDADSNKKYTIMMIDCDAPMRERPSHRDWLHWMVVNVPGDNINRGVTKADYIGAAPPRGSGLHRYITMVFEQPASLHVNEFGHVRANSQKHRDRFQTKKFLGRYHLGPAPVAATLFEAEYDDIVPEIHAQFKD